MVNLISILLISVLSLNAVSIKKCLLWWLVNSIPGQLSCDGSKDFLDFRTLLFGPVAVKVCDLWCFWIRFLLIVKLLDYDGPIASQSNDYPIDRKG